jgi:hypothetical protein
MNNLTSHTLPNTATVLAHHGDIVLAWFRDSELVTWSIDADHNAHWGSYHGTNVPAALARFSERTGGAAVPDISHRLIAEVMA